MIFIEPPHIFSEDAGVLIGQGIERDWTILSLCEWGGTYLSDRGFDEARLHTELLLAHVLGITRMGLYLQFDRPLTKAELSGFKELLRRRLTHEPLQQILGEAVFMGLTLAVDRNVLIPRPETEILVEEGIRFLKSGGGRKVLDVGTGSGNIPIALSHFVPGTEILSVDLSVSALALAQRNLDRHGSTGVTLESRDVKHDGFPAGPFDLVISNPPYVAAVEHATLEPEVRTFEPAVATTDGGDGLSFFREILRAGAGLLAPGGVVMLEIGHGQSDSVQALAGEFGYRQCRFVNDYAGIPRVAICEPGAPVSGDRS